MIDNLNGKAINTIHNKREVIIGESPEFEILIKQNGTTVYHNKGYAGVVNIVQGKINLRTEEAEMEGDSQVFCFGNPALVWFAYDQIRVKTGKLMMQGVQTIMRLASPKLQIAYKDLLKKRKLTY